MVESGKNFHILEAVYVGASNFRGSSVRITSARFEKSKTVPYDYSSRDALDIAVKYLKKQGFRIIGHGEAKRGYYIVTDTFKSL